MAKVFITGSADGLGQMAAKSLIKQGHSVVLHARNAQRGLKAQADLPLAKQALIADLSDMEATKQLAAQANALGRFDAIIHNAGVYRVSNKSTFAVNTLAPYILTCLITPPVRLIYLSSGMHWQGNPRSAHLTIDTGSNYSDSKLHVIMLAKAVARKWPNTYANAVDPGWVPTKMGGPGAPDDLQKGVDTQVWLAISDDQEARVSGHYFHHETEVRSLPAADDVYLQEELLTRCEQLTGVRLPAFSPSV